MRRKTVRDRVIAQDAKLARDAAREVRRSMYDINASINNLAQYLGVLEAMFDNDNNVETLCSPRADKTFRLMGALSKSYEDLAGHLAGRFT